MYIAICIMLCGLVIGRLTRNLKFPGYLDKLILPSILLLLFLLGVSIGSNRQIMGTLPQLGFSALLLTVFGMAGSIFCVWLIRPFLSRKNTPQDKK